MKNNTSPMSPRVRTAYSALALAATLASVGVPTSKATSAALTWKKAVDKNTDRFIASFPDRRPLPARIPRSTLAA